VGGRKTLGWGWALPRRLRDEDYFRQAVEDISGTTGLD
jgi:hypothetical protein